MTLAIELPSTIGMAEDGRWLNFLNYVGLNSAALVALLVALLVKQPRVVLGAMIAQIVILTFVYSAYLRILGLS
jgi:hypothetical protein